MRPAILCTLTVMGQPVAFVVTAGEGALLAPDTALTGADGRAGGPLGAGP